MTTTTRSRVYPAAGLWGRHQLVLTAPTAVIFSVLFSGSILNVHVAVARADCNRLRREYREEEKKKYAYVLEAFTDDKKTGRFLQEHESSTWEKVHKATDDALAVLLKEKRRGEHEGKLNSHNRAAAADGEELRSFAMDEAEGLLQEVWHVVAASNHERNSGNTPSRACFSASKTFGRIFGNR
ncbi:unnamed protein product [Amoebophrya sp. A25]|nr:unnamed protein product [Amoebophrya sp. A25]|eukprot:GSA25T00021686001.1